MAGGNAVTFDPSLPFPLQLRAKGSSLVTLRMGGGVTLDRHRALRIQNPRRRPGVRTSAAASGHCLSRERRVIHTVWTSLNTAGLGWGEFGKEGVGGAKEELEGNKN